MELNTLQESLNTLGTAIDAFPWSRKRAYADWLAQTYYYVRHTTRLLALAASRQPLTTEGDFVHQRLAKHLAEENKHELLALQDVKRAGFDLATLPEHHTTRALYEPQYFKIEHGGPLAFFGYILALEGVSATKGAFVLKSVSGAGEAMPTAFLKVHADNDPEHLEKALAVLKGASPSEEAEVLQNLRQTTAAYVAMLDEINARSHVRNERTQSLSLS